MPNEPTEQAQDEQTQVSELLQAWQDIGEDLFADGDSIVVPKIEQVRDAAEMFAIELALTVRNGNITHAAGDLHMSRRAVREKLKNAKRYPWSPVWSLELSVSPVEDQNEGER